MMSARGRGARQGAVRIKVERVVHNQEGQESEGRYEDEVVYVTERQSCPRKRGRPKKPASVVTPVTSRLPPPPLPQRYQRPMMSNEVIYVTAGRGRPQYVIPPRSPAQHPGIHQPHQRSGALVSHPSRQLTMCAAVCPRPVRCVVSGVPAVSQSVVSANKPLLALGAQRMCVENMKIDWGPDLEELVCSWDNLPERRTRDMVKWFQSYSSKSPQPKLVREIQEMWANMPETWEEKVDLALEWLDGEVAKCSAPPSSSATPPVPKSSVQPSSSATPPVPVTAPLYIDTSYSNGVTQPSNGMALPSNSVATTLHSVVSPLKNVVLLSMNRAKVLVEAQPTPIQYCGQWSSMTENRESSSR